MTSSFRIFGGLAVVALVVAACGGGGGSDGDGGGLGGADAFVAQYCDIYGPCCAKSGRTYDAPKCRAVLGAFAGLSTYDPGAGQQCLDAVRAESNSASFCDSGLSKDADAKCDDVFKQAPSNGTKKPGEPCEDARECATSPEGDVTCSLFATQDTSVRQCQLKVRGKEGEDCVGEKEEGDDGVTVTSSSGSGEGAPPPRVVVCWISDGLFCESTSGSGSTRTRKCARIQDVGGPCASSSTHACVEAAYCDTAKNVCAARKAAGEPCGPFSSKECVDKHYCPSSTSTCTPSVPTGGACTKSEECERGSCVNGKCGSALGSSGATLFVCAQ